VAAGSADLARLKQALFAPRSVALVGASGDAAKNTARPQRFLRKHGYTGKIFPVNPSRPEVLGEKAFASIRAIDEPVDHAFIMVEDVESSIEQCGERGIPVASVYSDGFAEVGPEGVARQARLVERARALGVRLLGPNSMGVVNLSDRIAFTVNAVLEMDSPPAGGASLVSQSGTMLGTLLSRGAARGLGFSKLVSVGNEADLGVAELVGLLADDPQTRVILLFLETVRDARGLSAATRLAHDAGKPVAVYKLGRSGVGAQLAPSHTGALAGEDRALDAFFRDCGIVRVDMLETLIEIAPLLAGRKLQQLPRKPRVAVVTTTGGGAATVVDRLGLAGIDVEPFLDLTMKSTPQQYRQTLEGLLASADCDAVLATVGSSAQFHPRFALEPVVDARKTDKPLAAFLTPHAEGSLRLLAESGIAAFRTPEACADAFAALFAWKAPRQPACFARPDGVASLGIPIAQQAIAEAPHFRHDVPYPVAVKVLDAVHKTEVGGVALDIPDEQTFLGRAREMGKQKILVQRMERGLAEAIVGYRVDPVVGPVALVGAGGVLTELSADYALRMAPVSEAEAMEMIEEVKSLAVIRGYRNLPRGDVAALARAVSALSRLCLLPEIAEAEINPLIVKAEGVVAVDVRIVNRE
jgi:acyl-CoA synthetase (NDP forming)